MFYGGSEDEKKGLREARLSEGESAETGGVETVRPQEDSLNPNEDR